MKLTTEQNNAVEAPCSDNLVSAAAGSGKTAVMVQRIVKRVLEGKVDIDRILVVTFTNAAASELKSRLMSEIMNSLDKTSDPDRLNRQLMLINGASISTIDSFCLNVLRNNFFKVNLEPGFKVGDGTELELMKEDALNEIFEEYYREKDERFLKLVEHYTTKNDDALMKIIRKLFSKTTSVPEGISCLDNLAEKFKTNKIWADYFLERAHRICKTAIGYYDDALLACEGVEGIENAVALLNDERNKFVLIDSRTDWDDMKNAVEASKKFGTLSMRKLGEEDKKPIKIPRDNAKSICMGELLSIFYADYETLANDTAEAFCDIEKLVEITKKFALLFAQKKLEAGMVDFNDVEHMTLKLLMNDDGAQSEVAVSLMEHFDEIYVDEYQDCNEVQEKLFSLISSANAGKPNMFMVGDMKQSIYGFRGSEPTLFKYKADTYKPYGLGEDYSKIILNKNFRSNECVIDAVNFVFSQIMTEKCGGLDYDKDEYLYFSETGEKNPNPDVDSVDVVYLESTASSANPEIEDIHKTEAEAIYVANKIKEIVNSDYLVFDKKKEDYRKAKYSDIVVLLRSGKEKGETFNRILTTAQIPVYCEMGDSYFENPEITFLTSFLKIIDNPLDDIAYLSVMRHPVFAFDEDDFVSIRLAKRKGYFCNSVKAYMDSNDDELSKRLGDFTKLLKDCYERSKYLPTDKLLWQIIRELDYLSYLSFLPNPELKKANVRALISKAYDFEKTSYKGIFDFIRYIDSFKKSSMDVESAKILSDDEDVVRIMTIHKSKGLEFPIVFVCDAAKGFNDEDMTKEKILFHRTSGFGTGYYSDNYCYDLPGKKMVKKEMYSQMYSEEMRVLYVALTRAREKLFIVGSGKGIRSRIEKISGLLIGEKERISADTAQFANSFFEWIIMALVRCKRLDLTADGVRYKTPMNDRGLFNFEIIEKNSVSLNLDVGCERKDFEFLPVDADECERIGKILDYRYPYAVLNSVPSNMTVTELKKLENRDDVYDYYHTVKLTSPMFYDGQGEPTYSERGTFTHLVMEKLDFECADSVENIALQIEKLVQNGFLTKNQAQYVNTENICRMLSTDVGEMLKQNLNTLKREFSFKYLFPAGEISFNVNTDEKIVVQGTIDAFFVDKDGFAVIVDYKTDRVKSNIEDIKKRYAPQLKYYKIAIEKSLKIPVKKTYLFLLDSGDAVECNV